MKNQQPCPKCDNNHPVGIECPVALGMGDTMQPIGKPRPIEREMPHIQPICLRCRGTCKLILPISQEEKTEGWEKFKESIKLWPPYFYSQRNADEDDWKELESLIRELLQQEREKVVRECVEVVEEMHLGIYDGSEYRNALQEVKKKLQDLLGKK